MKLKYTDEEEDSLKYLKMTRKTSGEGKSQSYRAKEGENCLKRVF
jgi:hypothetical protein